LIAEMEMFDSLVVVFLDLLLSFHRLISVIKIVLFLALNTHDAHEIVSRVTKLRASEVNRGKVVHCESGFIEINNSSLSE